MTNIRHYQHKKKKINVTVGHTRYNLPGGVGFRQQNQLTLHPHLVLIIKILYLRGLPARLTNFVIIKEGEYVFDPEMKSAYLRAMQRTPKYFIST